MWVKSGKKDALALAKERMEEILSTHNPMPLSPEEEQALVNILIEARKYYRDKGLISDEDWVDYERVVKAG